jgi:hypothetical protein
MNRPTGYFNVARYLQSTSAARFVEFKHGGFFCGYEEVTGKKFIINLLTLHFARVTREGNRIVSVSEAGSLWGRSPNDLRSVCENVAPAGSLSNGWVDAGAEQALILGLEDYETGAITSLVVQDPDGRAAIGRLCNLCGRRSGYLDGIVVKLIALKQAGPTGYPITVPEFSLVDHGGRPVDDDIPF